MKPKPSAFKFRLYTVPNNVLKRSDYRDYERINDAILATKKEDKWRIEVWIQEIHRWIPQALMGRIGVNSRLNTEGFMAISQDGRMYIGREWLCTESSQLSSEDTSETKEKVKQPKLISMNLDKAFIQTVEVLKKFSASVLAAEVTQEQLYTQEQEKS